METTLHSSKKIPKLKSLSGTVSPLNTDSSLIRYLCSANDDDVATAAAAAFSSPTITSAAKSSSGSNSLGRTPFSPLSSIENVMMMSPSSSSSVNRRGIRRTSPAMKVVDDDVIVMDGILVESEGGSVSNRVFSSRYLTSQDSNSGSTSSYKVELCRSFENFGHCRRCYSSCQFAHGKEELRPTCFHMKNKPEIHSSFKSPSPRSYAQALAPRSSSPPLDMKEAGTQMGIPNINEFEYPSLTTSTSPTNNTSYSRKPRTPTNPEELSKKSPNYQHWSPLDDGIEVALSEDIDTKSQSSKKDVDAHIDSVLYGPSARKRLPVFSEFCPQ